MTIDFTPASIALVGASDDPTRISGRPLQYLRKHDYSGTIYPVNPNHEEIGGRECYSSVEELPETPDLAVVLLPSSLVLEVVEDCLTAGIEDVLIVSSGFAETGTEAGRERERALAELAEAYDANVIGPNSQGLMNLQKDVTASFTPALERDELASGPVSFVTQSGAFGGALTTLLQEASIGLNKWIATGNEAARGAADVMAELAHDDETEIVVSYLEGFEDGRTLVELKRTDAGIELPIVALKVGTSPRGGRAASAHTGTDVGDSAVYDDVFREHGVITVGDIDSLVSVIETLRTNAPLPGGSLGVLSTSGGAGVYVADCADERGVELASLSPSTRDRIAEQLPAYGSAVNPVDTTAAVIDSVEAARECLSALFEDSDVDTVLFQITNLSGQSALELADIVCSISAEYDKPLLVCWTGGTNKDDALERYASADVPVSEYPSRCIDTIAAIDDFRESKAPLRSAADLPARLLDRQSTEDDTMLGDPDVMRLLEEYSIEIRSGTPDDVRAREPVECELTLGTIVDDHFGPLVRLARGGTGGEAREDSTYRTIPTVPEQAMGMVTDLDTVSADSLTDEQRGAITETVRAVSELYTNEPWIQTIDIESLLVTTGGVVAVDATITGAEDEY